MRGFVNDLAADYGHGAGRGENFGGGDFQDVFRENGEIGELAGFEEAFVSFFEGGVGGGEGEHFQGLLARDGLLGVPSGLRQGFGGHGLGGFAFDAFASDGGVEFDHR